MYVEKNFGLVAILKFFGWHMIWVTAWAAVSERCNVIGLRWHLHFPVAFSMAGAFSELGDTDI